MRNDRAQVLPKASRTPTNLTYYAMQPLGKPCIPRTAVVSGTDGLGEVATHIAQHAVSRSTSTYVQRTHLPGVPIASCRRTAQFGCQPIRPDDGLHALPCASQRNETSPQSGRCVRCTSDGASARLGGGSLAQTVNECNVDVQPRLMAIHDRRTRVMSRTGLSRCIWPAPAPAPRYLLSPPNTARHRATPAGSSSRA